MTQGTKKGNFIKFLPVLNVSSCLLLNVCAFTLNTFPFNISKGKKNFFEKRTFNLKNFCSFFKCQLASIFQGVATLNTFNFTF